MQAESHAKFEANTQFQTGGFTQRKKTAFEPAGLQKGGLTFSPSTSFYEDTTLPRQKTAFEAGVVSFDQQVAFSPGTQFATDGMIARTPTRFEYPR